MKNTNSILRFFKHFFSHPWQVKRHLSVIALHEIEKAITASEKKHGGEIRLVVESGLHPYEILCNKTPRKRAIELFGRLNIWDTELNNGVLIYLLLADRDVEIVADRGINQHVTHAEWEKICRDMEVHLRAGDFEAGVQQGIAEISAHMQRHFPRKNSSKKPKKNELSDKPLVL